MQTIKKTPFKGIHYMTFTKLYNINIIIPNPKRITKTDDTGSKSTDIPFS